MPTAIRAISRIQDADDVTLTPSSAMSGNALIYDHGTGKLIPSRVVTADASRYWRNIIWDPWHMTRFPSLITWGNNRSRWYKSNGSSSLTLASGISVLGTYGARDLVFSPVGSNEFYGKYIYLDECGAVVGDTLNLGCLVTAAAGEQHRLWCKFRSDSDWIGSTTQSSAAVTGTGAQQTNSLSVTIPTGATVVIVGCLLVPAAPSTLTVHGLWGNIGTSFVGAAVPTPINDVPVFASAVNFPPAAAVYGRHYLRDWFSRISKIRQADGTSQAVIACIGDSWTHTTRFHTPVRTALQAAYGNAGAGYGHAGSLTHVAGVMANGITRSEVGTWIYTDEYDGANARGVALGHATSVDVATPASLAWTADVHAFVLHYLKIPTGGSFRYRVDSGSWTAVDTANATEVFASVTVSGLDGNSHALTCEMVTAGTAGVTLLGCDCQKTGNGVRIHDIANNGSSVADWVAVDSTIWKAGLTALAPNLVVIMLGINDSLAAVAVSTYGANLSTLIDRVRSACPVCDILVIAPGDHSAGTMQAYATEARRIAYMKNCACIDLLLHLGTYTEANGRGLYSDTAHLNALGGQQIADVVVRQLEAI